MIPMGGCLADQFRREYLAVAMDLQIPLVITAGDHDYNRAEAFDSYLYLRQMGFKNVYYLQDPEQHHSILTAKNLDKAIGVLNTNRHYPD